MDNIWLPYLRSTLHKVKVDIPRYLYDISEDYATLSFGIKFFSDGFCREGRLWTANSYGTAGDVGFVHNNKLWTDNPAEGDRNLMKKFLMSTETFASLHAYRKKNVLYQQYCQIALEGTRDFTTHRANQKIHPSKLIKSNTPMMKLKQFENNRKLQKNTN